MPAFRIEIRKDQLDQDGKAPLRLRISHKNVRRFVPIDAKIHPRHWNDKTREARKSYKESASINDFLKSVVSIANESFNELAKQNLIITSDRIKNRVIEKLKPHSGSGNFLTYARAFVEDYKREEKVSTYKSNTVVLNKLEKFMPGLSFDDITPNMLRQFDVHLKEVYKNNLNTRSKNLAKIKTILFAAIREGRFPQEKNPFFQVKLRTKESTKTHLRPEEIKKITDLELKKGSGVWHARNYFMFSFYMFGIRYSDVAKLKPENVFMSGGNLRCKWEMDKVDKNHGVLVTPPAKAIMDLYEPGRFIFPILEERDTSSEFPLRSAIESTNVIVNKNLKKIMKLADIKTNISFHIARHSIAGHLMMKGWNIYDISKALGHSSIKQTEVYFRGFDFHDLDSKMNDLWD